MLRDSGSRDHLGAIPLTGVWPLAPSLDTVGPMARDVATSPGWQLLEPGFSVTAEAPQVVGRVVIGADPVIDTAVDNALAAAGWDVVQVGLDGLDRATVAAMTVLDAEAWASDGGYAEAAPDKIGLDVLARLREASTVTPAALAQPRRRRRAGARPCRHSGNASTCSRSRRCWDSRPPWISRGRWSVFAASPPRSTWPECRRCAASAHVRPLPPAFS